MVLQVNAVEVSEVRSAILKKCVVYFCRSAHQYVRSAHWYFILKGLSNKRDVRTDLWEVSTDRYQRSVDFWELHTDIWELRSDSDIWEVRIVLWEVQKYF